MEKKEILESICKQFQRKTKCGIVIGVEQEFYVGGASSQQELVANGAVSQQESITETHPFVEHLNQALAKFPFFSKVAKERGNGQFEIAIHPTDSPLVMAEAVMMLRKIIKDESSKVFSNGEASLESTHIFNGASFLAKPFPQLPGSAMQVNINLVNEEGKNLFAKVGEGESKFFTQSIAGMLEVMPASMKYFAPYDKAYLRYKGGMEAPSTVSWGGDNRTVALRVPSAPIAKHTRHIEHRIPAADADPYLVFAAIIAGMEYGMVNRLENKHPKIFGNAFLPEYKLEKLPQSFEKASSIKHEYLEYVMGAFGCDSKG